MSVAVKVVDVVAEKPSPHAHFDKVAALLERYEREFKEAVANQHAPPDVITGFLNVIHALRVEKAHLRP